MIIECKEYVVMLATSISKSSRDIVDIESLLSENKKLEDAVTSLRLVEDENNELIRDLMMKIEYLEGKLAGYKEALQLRN